uniref:Ion transport domain-containing protein n=1 Tax=Micromonas pusilla TaxID=38833 RepID=A0A7S0NGR6_MICPS
MAAVMHSIGPYEDDGTADALAKGFGPYDHEHVKAAIIIQRLYRGWVIRHDIATALEEQDLGPSVLLVRKGRPLKFAREWQRTLYTYVEEGDNAVNTAVSYAVVVLIFIATVGFILETVPEWARRKSVSDLFKTTETVCIALFTLEIACKVASQPQRGPVKGQESYWRGVAAWIKRPMNQVDVVAVLPWYLELAVSGGGSGLAVLRAIRLVRVFRVFKLGRYNTSAMIFKRALERSAQPLSLLFYFMLIANILFASAVYYAEAMGANSNPSDVDNFDDPLPAFPFDSIPRAMYWCMVTMTTVGYGDMYPITLIGRIVAVITMLSGIVVLAMPITLIGSNFVEEYRKSQANELKEKRRKESSAKAIEEIRKEATLRVMLRDPDSNKALQRLALANVSAGADDADASSHLATPAGARRRLSGRVAGHDVLSPGERIVSTIARREERERRRRIREEDEAAGIGGSAPWDTQVTPPPRPQRDSDGSGGGGGGGGGGLDNDAAERLREMEQRLARMEAMLTRIMNPS